MTEHSAERPTPGPRSARPTPGPKSDGPAPGPQRPRLRLTRRSAAWVVGAAVLVAATGAAGFVAHSSTPKSAPKPAADSSSTKHALDALVAQHPAIGRPINQLVKQGLPKPTYEGDMGRIGVPKNAKLSTADGKTAQYVPGSVHGAFNLLQLGSLALWAGCSKAEAPIAAAIAAAESGGNPGAQGDISLMDGTWDWSQGLWQIRGLRSERGTGGLRDSLGNANPQKNAQAMYTISSGCTDWTPWSTFVSGAYLPYLGMSKTAVLAAQQFHSQTGSFPVFGTGTGTAVTVPKPQPTTAHGGKHHHAGSGKGAGKGGGKGSGRHHSSPSGHKSGHPITHGTGAPQAGSTQPVAPRTSKAPGVVPTSSAAAPNPVSSIVSRVTSAVPLPTKIPLPKPSKTKLPLPSPVSSLVSVVSSLVPTKLPVP